MSNTAGHLPELWTPFDVSHLSALKTKPAFIYKYDDLLNSQLVSVLGIATVWVHAVIYFRKQASLIDPSWFTATFLGIYHHLMSYKTHLSRRRGWQHWFVLRPACQLDCRCLHLWPECQQTGVSMSLVQTRLHLSKERDFLNTWRMWCEGSMKDGCGWGVQPASSYWKVAGLVPLVCILKCPWARY